MGYRAQQVLNLVATTVTRDGTPPSYAMIADRLDMTTSDVCNVIRHLERRGFLERRSVKVRRDRGWHRPVIVLLTPTT